MGVDGISLPFIFLAALLSVLCVSASWTTIQTRVREFYAALLVAETAMIGLFATSNLFLFFVFWELMVIPMFLIIGVWGGPGRVYSLGQVSAVHAGRQRFNACGHDRGLPGLWHAGLQSARGGDD